MTSGVELGSGQYATFRVGDHYLGVGVLEVQEVLREQRITPVPLASAEVAGLINLRGQIVPELEMRRLLRLPDRNPDDSRFSVVVRTAHGVVSLLVDQIEDVLELDASSFELPPRNMDPQVRDLLLGVHRLQRRLLLILDIPRTAGLGCD
jgi:chemotaxis signal transduction protein